VAALSISIPTVRYRRDHVADLVTRLRQVAARIEIQLLLPGAQRKCRNPAGGGITTDRSRKALIFPERSVVTHLSYETAVTCSSGSAACFLVTPAVPRRIRGRR
jgi:hypothetical protein